MITPRNTNDTKSLRNNSFIEKIVGKQYANKGYNSQNLIEALFVDGISLVTGIKNNMRNTLFSLSDKILLRKRSVIETVKDELKTMCQVEHSRHRRTANLITNVLSAIEAYSFFPKKPSIKYEVDLTCQLSLF